MSWGGSGEGERGKFGWGEREVGVSWGGGSEGGRCQLDEGSEGAKGVLPLPPSLFSPRLYVITYIP